jgi:hypothetical protein
MDISDLSNFSTQEEYNTISSIVEGAKLGDKYCQILVHEYMSLLKDDDKLKTFLKIVRGETSEMACRKWYYIDKQIFIDNRKYL